jgi:hypothetical protein
MKLKDVREAFESLSGSASKLNRKLYIIGAIAGIILSSKIIVLVCICSAIADLLQYVYSSFIWYLFYYNKRSDGVTEDTEVNEPEDKNIVTWTLFYCKVIWTFLAYVHILIAVWKL